MSDEDALLAAIAAQPEEDTPRLAYADWLDENAALLPDPELARVRAEFIRVQTERLRCPYWLPEHTARYSELCRREQAIEGQYRAAILGLSSGAGYVEVRFSRGLPELRMPVGVFLARADEFARLRPPELALSHVADKWYDLFTHPRLPYVTRVQLYTPEPWGDPASWSVVAGVVGQIGGLARGNRIRGLDLSRCRAGDGVAIQLAEHADVWQLEDLDLSRNEIEYTGLMELLLSPIPQTLRRVNLCDNPLNDLAARAIVERWPSNDALKWIRLERTSISPAGRQLLRDCFGEKVEFEPPSPFG